MDATQGTRPEQGKINVTERPLLQVFDVCDKPPRRDAAYHREKISQAATLTDLSGEYVFFTHALLFTHALWPYDPVLQYIQETNGGCLPFFIRDLPLPLFSGLDLLGPDGKIADKSWNYAVSAVARDDWLGLLTFLTTQITGVAADRKFLHTTVMQRVPVVDVQAQQRLSVLPDAPPLVDCFCLAIPSNRWTAKFEPRLKKSPWDPVPVIKSNEDAAVKRAARKLFWGDALKQASGLSLTAAAQHGIPADVMAREMNELLNMAEVTSGPASTPAAPLEEANVQPREPGDIAERTSA